MKLMTLSVIADVFADAVLTDEGNNLLFLSVWGRDTAVQEFLARLTLPKHEDGIRDFRVEGSGESRYVNVPSIDCLDKHSTRVGSDIFDNLTQVWIYDKRVLRSDQSSRRVYQLFSETQKCPDPWPLVKAVCPVPLLDHWRETVLEQFTSLGWCRFVPDGVGMKALCIDLGDPDLEETLSLLVKQGKLSLPGQSDPVMLGLAA